MLPLVRLMMAAIFGGGGHARSGERSSVARGDDLGD